MNVAHETVMEAHRRPNESHQYSRRMAWWKQMARDFNAWYMSCEICHRHRARGVQALLRSMQAEDARWQVTPLEDVIVDVRGPYAVA